MSQNPHQSHWSKFWKLQSCAVALTTTCFFALSPVALAHGMGGNGGSGGNNGGNMSGQNSHGGPSHYQDPFGSPWHPGYAGNYDSNYSYTPTPEQAATAKKRVKDYLAAVQKGRRRAAAHRYVAVETLRPTKTQLADYLKKRAQAKSTAEQLRCMMVYDVQSKQFVGSGCYVVESLPSVGTVAKFDTFSAEYVGTTAL